MLTLDKLPGIHRGLLVTDPNEVQTSLYGAFPEFRGFSGRDLNTDRFLATLVLGMAQTYPFGGTAYHPVALLVSKHAEEWAVGQIRQTVQEIIARLKSEDRVQGIQMVRGALGALMLGCRALQIDEPPRWAAFGFDRADPIPEWMQGSLL
jgi:hypothetical protein